jgi:hypothetical protein
VVWLPLLPYRRPRPRPAGDAGDGQGNGAASPGGDVTEVSEGTSA